MHLQASTEKSGIHNARDATTFLSYGIVTWSANKSRKVRIKRGERYTTVRGGVHGIKLTVPREKLVKFARERGYGPLVGTLNAKHRTYLLNSSEYEIGVVYNAEMRGLANYYGLADDVKRKLNKLYGLWQTSLFKTLANKRKRTISSIAKALNRGDQYAIRYRVNDSYEFLRLYKLMDLKKQVFTYGDVDRIPQNYRFTLSRTEAVERLNANGRATRARFTPLSVSIVDHESDVQTVRRYGALATVFQPVVIRDKDSEAIRKASYAAAR